MKIASKKRRLGTPPLVLALTMVCIPVANIYFLGYMLNSGHRYHLDSSGQYRVENFLRKDDLDVIKQLVMNIPNFIELVFLRGEGKHLNLCYSTKIDEFQNVELQLLLILQNLTRKQLGSNIKRDHILFVCWNIDLIDSVETEASIRILTLAKIFVERKHKVTVLIVNGNEDKVKHSESWENAIEWEYLPDSKVAYVTSSAIATSHRIMEWLRTKEDSSETESIDVVYFQDTLGLGYYSLLARHQGLAFGNIKMIILMFRPFVWTKIVSSEGLTSDSELAFEYQEVECLRYADWVISLTKELVVNGHPFQPYAKILQQQQASFVIGTPLIPNELVFKNPYIPTPSYTSHEKQKTTEIIYIGSLFHDQSIKIFCDAIDRILKAFPNRLKKLDCTFLIAYQQREERNSTAAITNQNRSTSFSSLESYHFITERVKKWSSKMKSTKIEFISNTRERTAYLRKANGLGVITTVFSDLPALILELMSTQVRFVSLNREGISQILSDRGKECILSQDNTAYSLASKIVSSLDNNTGLCKDQALLHDSLGELEQINRHWTDFHERYVTSYEPGLTPRKDNSQMESNSSFQQGFKLTVCIATYNSAVQYLKTALNSLRAQYYQNFEIVIVDDGSRDNEILSFLTQIPEEYSDYDLRVEHQENRGPGAARNKCAGVANSDFLFFMDDDNVAKPTELETLISVMLRTNADAVACANDFFSGDRNPIEEPPREHGRWIPLGSAELAGLFTNVYGDTNSLTKKSSFLAVGGFPEDYSYALEDWELFARMVAKGFKLEVVPVVQYWYRLKQGSHSRITPHQDNNMRTIRPYLETIPLKYHLLLYLLQGLAHKTYMQDMSYSALQKSTTSAFENMKVITISLEAICSSASQAQTKNLLSNSDFGTSDNENENILEDWWPFGKGYIIDHFQNRDEGVSFSNSQFDGGNNNIPKISSLKLSSSNNQGECAAYQVVVLNQEKPSVLLIEGWSKAEHVSGNQDDGYSIYIDIHFTDGDQYWGYATSFETGSHDWASSKKLIKMEKPILSLDVYAMFRGHTGIAWFDDFSLTVVEDGKGCTFSLKNRLREKEMYREIYKISAIPTDICALSRIAREATEGIAGSL